MPTKNIQNIKNWLLPSKKPCITNYKKLSLFIVCVLQTIVCNSQIANYINNGGFEKYYGCGIAIENAKSWRTIDSSSAGAVLYCNTCIPNVPNNSYTYQWPHSGNSYGQTSVLCQTPQCSPYPNRGYFRNRLKANLINGKTYCVKAYVNVSDPSSYGISNIGFFFVDNSIDTITKISAILSYINPQVENPSTNMLTDTMNWVAITGTFVANGTEKNCVIGNFRTNAATTKTLINTTMLPAVACDILIDDVSCIPLDLPAYAGADIWAMPGSTIYIGRAQDVGIDEACLWYNLTNTITPIANLAGITVTVSAITQTYMVKQDICGVIKYDTVVVHASSVGLNELKIKDYGLKIYPNPVNDVLNVEFINVASTSSATDFKIEIINSLGQVIREEVLRQAQQPDGIYTAVIDTKELLNGVYVLTLSSRGTRDQSTDPSYRQDDNAITVTKRFVITR